MHNTQRTTISNPLLSTLGLISTCSILTCMIYSYKLLFELCTDNTKPTEVCTKINRIKIPEYIIHMILFWVLILKGWWITAFLDFPFLFYNYSQWYLGTDLLDSTAVFGVLSRLMLEVKVKSAFLILVVFYNVWAWITWLPDYTP